MLKPSHVKRILVVHPDEEVRQEVVATLGGAGFEVIPAIDGRDALAKTYDSYPDLIVMAEHLSPINADLPSIRIRQASNVPIIVLGDDAREWAGIHFLESGADVYMTYPLDLRELLARVRSLLRCSRPSQSGKRGHGHA